VPGVYNEGWFAGNGEAAVELAGNGEAAVEFAGTGGVTEVMPSLHSYSSA